MPRMVSRSVLFAFAAGLPHVLALTALPPASATAQEAAAQRTLADLRRAFEAEEERLHAGDSFPTAAQLRALHQRQAKELASFVEHEARGDERWTARLWLAEMRARLRDKDGALATLRAIDPKTAGPVPLLLAADAFAQLGDGDARDRWVAAALDREAPFAERAEAARILMTLLREVEAGERIFTQALAAAKDDEERAAVRWQRAAAVREREDLPENSYYQELETLAKDLPSTYYGSVARDRCRASQFSIGAEAIPFSATTVDGKQVRLQDWQGKAVLLVFWAARDPRAPALVQHLQMLQKEHPEDLQLLGIAIDEDCAAFAKAAAKAGASFPQVCDGRGYESDLALRYHVETVPTLIAIDRAGKIAGLNLHAATDDAREQLREALTRALAR